VANLRDAPAEWSRQHAILGFVDVESPIGAHLPSDLKYPPTRQRVWTHLPKLRPDRAASVPAPGTEFLRPETAPSNRPDPAVKRPNTENRASQKAR
jgi:hypothetical protein